MIRKSIKAPFTFFLNVKGAFFRIYSIYSDSTNAAMRVSICPASSWELSVSSAIYGTPKLRQSSRRERPSMR